MRKCKNTYETITANPCPQCGGIEFLYHPDVKELCVHCLNMCMEILEEPIDDPLEEAITMYCLFLEADKTPGN